MFEKILEALAERLKTAELLEPVISALEGAKQTKDKLGLIDNSDDLYFRKDSGEWIPRAKVDEERTKMKKQIDEQTTSLTTLQETIEKGGDAKLEIEKMKVAAMESGKVHDEATADLKKSHAVDIAILGCNLTDVEYAGMIKAKLDMSIVQVSETGVVVGLDEQIKQIRELPAFRPFFGEKKIVGQKPVEGKVVEPSNDTTKLGENYQQVLKENGAVHANTIAAKRAWYASVEADKTKSAVLAA